METLTNFDFKLHVNQIRKQRDIYKQKYKKDLKEIYLKINMDNLTDHQVYLIHYIPVIEKLTKIKINIYELQKN